ncbi:MAG: GH92 family glycosyl hydrolase [Bacteroidetes bacterium]|nr:GH92 family glycosyl hydrolase [Bacteroidota bacterium]
MKLSFRISIPLAIIILLAFTSCNRNDVKKIHIIPKPWNVWDNKGYFDFSGDTRILYDGLAPESKEVAVYFAEKIAASTGTELAIEDVTNVKSISNDILFSLQGADSLLGDEGYFLQIKRNHVILQANTARGLFYGVQTMLQLMPPEIECKGGLAGSDLRLPCVFVRDKPAFQWRGMHLDVGRHFFPADSVKKFIDLLALHKMNTFHWHLTEDQGWRIEIKKYPRLAEVSAWRQNRDGSRYGGYYTQDEVRDIVDYASSRYITIVPEIEMPGHSLAALAAYPEYSCTGGPFQVTDRWGVYEDVYCAGKEGTFTFLEGILDEVTELFPGKYIHIGGDECPKARWEKCPDCQRRIRVERLADEHELQSYFIKRMEKYLNGKGKSIIGWDEILEGGLAPEATVMSWRGVSGGIEAAQQGHDVVMSPTSHCYFDYYQGDPSQEPKAIGGFTPLEKVYGFDPVPAALNEEEANFILGGQGNLWTEYIPTWSHLEYMALPRMSALSEVLWTSSKRRDYDSFLERLGYLFDRLDAMGYHYRIPEPGLPHGEVFLTNDTVITLESPFHQAKVWVAIDDDSTGKLYSGKLVVDRDMTVRARTVMPDGRQSIEARTRFEVLNEYARYVNPFIGTDGHGHTFPGATTPFGMVQLSPDTRKDSWDGCSGYHYSDSTILGFSMTHLSGTGVGDYGDFRFMPGTGEVQIMPGSEEDPGSGYRSRFRHDTESASPGYYKVFLDDYGVSVELTATPRAGLQRYVFPKSGQSHVLIDLKEGVTSDKVIESEVRIVSDRAVEGFRRTRGWADDQYLYFYAEFSKAFKDFGIAESGEVKEGKDHAKGNDLKAYVSFSTDSSELIMVKTGISAVSAENARKNLMQEIPGFDFNKVRRDALVQWNDELGRISVSGGSEEERISFYTALYHSFIAPNLYSDVDGKYRGHDLQVHESKTGNIYTVFSLWDTFRALHPLFTIIQQERTNELINTMLDIYRTGGLLPVWELAANETWCMIGYHSIPVIADAYAKGIRGYDADLALRAMIRSAGQDHHGLKYLRQYGYIPAGKEGESVSKTLEYAYDDWCIAQMGQWLGKSGTYEEFIQRAQYYKNLYDPSTGFMRGKINGMFVEPFNPAEVNFMLTEANTWQYNFFVPQDVAGLMELMGGEEAFNRKLDEMFNAPQDLAGRQQADITGLIGQYAHGNEPSHHMAYLYNYSGQPWKTQELVRRIMKEMYTDKPDGLCGNEDCGQMSAWYVLSAMGLYAVVPGIPEYAIGSPLFDTVRINLENGKTFTLIAKGNGPGNPYIQSAVLNGILLEKCYITQEDIMDGGELILDMGKEPSTTWGVAPENRPHSAIRDFLITPVPFVKATGKTFTQSMEVSLGTILDGCTIYYTLDDSEPTTESMTYTSPFVITENTTLKAFAVKEGLVPSKVVEASFNKMPEGRSLEIRNPYNTQYTAGGDIALIDQLRGGDNFRTGFWQGYYGVDLEVILDLGKIQDIHVIGIGFLQDQKSWIFMPEEVSFYFSDDKNDFQAAGTVKNDVDEKYEGGIIKDFMLQGLNEQVRYIKIIARNRGVCPEWHVGAGNKAWIFADEIIVE